MSSWWEHSLNQWLPKRSLKFNKMAHLRQIYSTRYTKLRTTGRKRSKRRRSYMPWSFSNRWLSNPPITIALEGAEEVVAFSHTNLLSLQSSQHRSINRYHRANHLNMGSQCKTLLSTLNISSSSHLSDIPNRVIFPKVCILLSKTMDCSIPHKIWVLQFQLWEINNSITLSHTRHLHSLFKHKTIIYSRKEIPRPSKRMMWIKPRWLRSKSKMSIGGR